MSHNIKNKILFIIFLLFAIVLYSCNTAKLSTANEQFERGEYNDASKTYRKVYNKLTKKEDRPLRGQVAYQLATCYRKLNMFSRASAAYQNAIRYEYPDSITFFYLGRSLQGEGKYAQAIKAYEEFLIWKPNHVLALEGISGCKFAIDHKETKTTRYIVKQAKLFNSRRSDFCPMFLDGNFDQLYFSSTNEKSTGDNKSEITGTKKSDIFFSKKDEQGEWQRPEPVEGELNTDAEEGICSFSPDGQTMYFTKARREPNSNTSVEIFTSQRSEAQWSSPVKYEVINDTISAVGHPAVSPDGKYLYFCSDMPGGFGGKDIWRINLLDKIGSLENLGPQINTEGDEMFPYLRMDTVIYFASDGHPGFGGLDLFRAAYNIETEQWFCQNMGTPLNSSADDFGITFGVGETGFFSSNRGDGRGYDHIFSFELPELEIAISGWVLDKDEEPIPNAIIRIVGNDGSNQKEVARDDGSFRFKLNRGVKYVMMAGAKGYLNVKQEFESDLAEEDIEYGIDFILSAIHKPQVIENIFYDFDKAVLRDESKVALDEMAQILKDNPNISIEMASHTDRWGSDEYNINLSNQRAQSVIDYLIAAGISADRLKPQGYGETVPKTVTKKINREYPQFQEGTVLTEEFIETLSEEDQEIADQINRRTEFQVTSIDFQTF